MKTTTEPESRESKEPAPGDQGDKRPDDDLKPDFPIETTGGPSDGGTDPNTRPIQPPKTT